MDEILLLFLFSCFPYVHFLCLGYDASKESIVFLPRLSCRGRACINLCEKFSSLFGFRASWPPSSLCSACFTVISFKKSSLLTIVFLSLWLSFLVASLHSWLIAIGCEKWIGHLFCLLWALPSQTSAGYKSRETKAKANHWDLCGWGWWCECGSIVSCTPSVTLPLSCQWTPFC